MTIFTDPSAAVDEAQYLAALSGEPFSVVRTDSGMQVIRYTQACRYNREILETVNPSKGAA
ncbi:hypothetical protein [Halomonas cupida]|uniref:hypothetical protein n=1 Tax=Halomonas cupida TaxID=44933 RepID=UPI003A949952